MYLIIRKDTHQFFAGYEPRPPKPNFYHSPAMARKYQSKLNAKGIIQDMRAEYPWELSGAKLEVIEEELSHKRGRFFDYYLFEDFLIVRRRDYSDGNTKWNNIYESTAGYDVKWNELTEDDAADGIAHRIDPEMIGALTEAPIIGFDINTKETMFGTEGELTEDSKLYWFPDYMTVDELEKLDRQRYLVMERAKIETKSQTNES